MKNQKKAFSLLELLVVILILGLLAGVVAPKIIARGEGAKRDLACVSMKSIGEALKMFKLDNGVYPDTEEGLNALITNPDSDKYPNYARMPYMEKLPKDSWGTHFTYIKNDTKYELISFGSDRKEGGSGDGEDIFLSKCK
ncbi:General secretion pathway protein G [hydrothermal vent metagenome]|uniref:Type II secretion system core protein G n=1 Tax=hydrothermal vent metagenome TaxID=652676 RepID=A0A1W1EIT4_9ZZZZ